MAPKATSDDLRILASHVELYLDALPEIGAAAPDWVERNRRKNADLARLVASLSEPREQFSARVELLATPPRMSMAGVTVTCAEGGVALLRRWALKARVVADAMDASAPEDAS